MSPPNLVRAGWFRNFIDVHSNLVELFDLRRAARDGEILPDLLPKIIALNSYCVAPTKAGAKS
jgi:hypothetical protein